MSETGSPRPDLTAARRRHRDLVLALGGFGLEITGGTLVTHERVPVPAFNYVDGAVIAPRRQTAFFERALDHYFQRALRPTFRVEPPVPEHLDRTLRSLGFRPAAEPRVFLEAPTALAAHRETRSGIWAFDSERVRDVAEFWTHERERDEFARALEVAVHHPNPGEQMIALGAGTPERPTAAALLFRRDELAELEGVATLPEARGRGVATSVVEGALPIAARAGARSLGLVVRSQRLEGRLAPLGFRSVGELVEYELPKDAALAVPAIGPPQPPRWRPPRRPGD